MSLSVIITGGEEMKLGDPLSERETEVLVLVADGLNNDKIARRLRLDIETIKSHIRHILKKLGAGNRAHAVALGFRQGILA